MNITSELIKLLMEMGFLATNSGRLAEASTIFEGVAKARPDSGYPRIGLGCVALGSGNFSEAVRILHEAPYNDNDERDLCQAFLGMALKLSGHNDECRMVLTQLKTDGGNTAAVRMAGNLLEKF